jgi:hypothetical protein
MGIQNAREFFWRNNGGKRSCPSVDYSSTVENKLCNSKRKRPSKSLCEDDERHAKRDLLCGESVLDCNDSLFRVKLSVSSSSGMSTRTKRQSHHSHAAILTESGDKLVHDPLSDRRFNRLRGR